MTIFYESIEKRQSTKNRLDGQAYVKKTYQFPSITSQELLSRQGHTCSASFQGTVEIFYFNRNYNIMYQRSFTKIEFK